MDINPTAKEYRIEAQLMGAVHCEGNGRELAFAENTALKASKLFFLLLTAGKEGLSRRTVEELLYSDGEADFPSSYKTLLARLRKLLSEQIGPEPQECLLLSGGVLRFSEEISIRTDLSAFESAHNAAFEAKEPDERIRLLQDACALYGGELLPTLASEPWVFDRNVALRKMYSEDVSQLHAFFASRKDYEADYGLCRRAGAFFPYEEEWVIGCMEALHALGKHSQAMREYEEMSDRLYEELGVYPSEKLLDAVRRINDDLFSRSEAVQTLRETLSEDDELTGAYYCNYPAFMEHMKLFRRISRREKLAMTLIRLTVTDPDGQELTEEERILNALSVLRVALCRVLRASDLLTRLGKTKLLVLLWGTGPENVGRVMDRVVNAMDEEQQTEKSCFNYEILNEETVLRNATVTLTDFRQSWKITE